MQNFLLDMLCFGAIISAILVITSKNPVISVLFLISVFVNVAGYLVLLGVGFIGITYLIVYVGAIAILFLFVIMMLNLSVQELTLSGKEYTQNIPLGTILGSLFMFTIMQILPLREASSFLMLENTSLTNIFSNVVLGIINSFNSAFLGLSNNNLDIYETFNKSTTIGGIDSEITNFMQITSIGQMLYTNAGIWLIVCSIILLLAMVGPIALTVNKK